MSKGSLKLYLRRNGTTLASLDLTSGCEPVFVGRSRDCALRVPADEASVSGRHARIFWKGSQLYVEDAGSRNGVFHEGEQLTKPCRMRENGLFAIGNCQIVVGKMEKDGPRGQKRSHKLEFLNGDNAGKMMDIRPREGREDFLIGLDPSCDICLPDMLVSRQHAAFKLRGDGECWIEDLGSRNGTYVAGEKLSGKERLLKDGDKITVAYFDFRFLDYRYHHTRVHAWMKLVAMAVTVCCVAAAYVFWTLTRESVDVTMQKVRELAAVGDFTAARAMLDSSLTARDASSFRTQIDTLAGQIDLWKKTSEDWSAARADIAAGRFQTARYVLDRLTAGSLDSWLWNAQTASDLQREARFAGTALRLYYSGREAMLVGKGATPGFDKTVRSVIGPVEEFFASGDAAFLERDYMQPLVKELRALLADLRVVCDGFVRIDAYLAKISSQDPDFRPVLAEFERLASDAAQPPAVREYLAQQLDPCRAFVVAQDFVEKEFAKLVDLDFDGVHAEAEALKLPDPEICIRQTKYSDVRAAFMQKHADIQKEAQTLRTMVNGLAASGVTPDSYGEAVEAFLSSANWEKALSFDCLEKRPPSPRRREPSGVYDDMLGIELTYESLKALPNTYNGRSTRMTGFTPKCLTAHQAFEKAELFVQYLDNADKKYLQRGKLGRYYTQCIKVAIAREKMVSVLKALKGSKRRRLVAMFYAEYFTARPTYAAKRSIEAQFKSLARDVAERGDAYAVETDPEKQIAIRDKMFQTALPGDPILHPKWVQRFY